MKYSLKASRAEARKQAINTVYRWCKTLHNNIHLYVATCVCLYISTQSILNYTCGLDFKLYVILTLDKNNNCNRCLKVRAKMLINLFCRKYAKCFEFSPRRAVLYMRTVGLWPTKELFSYRIYGRHHKYEDIVR